MRGYSLLLTSLVALTDRVRDAVATRWADDDAERGDVPGWVMITVMTAALVLAILVPFRTAIVAAVQNALTSVTSG